jgi:dipeptidase
LQEEANEKTAQMLREAAADTLDKVLYELSGQMKNAYARSDA